MHNIDILNNCVKKFDFLQLLFYRMVAFFSLFASSHWYFIIDYYPVGYLISIAYCLVFHFESALVCHHEITVPWQL